MAGADEFSLLFIPQEGNPLLNCISWPHGYNRETIHTGWREMRCQPTLMDHVCPFDVINIIKALKSEQQEVMDLNLNTNKRNN